MIRGKLVRDNIPQIIEGKGEKAAFHVLDEEEFKLELLRKLVEEAQELLESGGDLTERADVAEVLIALDNAFDFQPESLEAARLDKLRARGGFVSRFYLHDHQ